MNELARDLAAVQRRVADIAGIQAGGAAPAGALGSTRPSGMLHASAGREFDAALRTQMRRLVENGAVAAGVDPSLALAVVKTESGFDPAATSGAGAAGLMQLMPTTAQALGVADPYDPVANVRGGASYLRKLLARFHGNIRLAVAAYNAGPGAVETYGGVPPYAETRAYVERVLEAYRANRLR